jgi:VCBS repeat-containing protein
VARHPHRTRRPGWRHLVLGTVLATLAIGQPLVVFAASSISLHGAAGGANTGTASVDLPRPGGTASGDVLVAAISVRGTPTVSSPSGWSRVRTDARRTALTQVLFVRVAGGSEPSTYTFTFSASGTAVGTIAAYAGVDTSNPIAADGGQPNGKSTTATAPSITPGVTGAQLVAFFGIIGKTTVTPPSGMTEQVETVSPGGTSSKVTGELADQALSSSGATGTRTATLSKSLASIGQVVALRPSSGGGTTNTPPVANDDSYSVAQDGSLAVGAPGVLGNDTDAENDPLTATLAGGPSHGALTLNANGSFAYTPNGGYSGDDSFTYRANDGTADSNVATVSITVTVSGGSGITLHGAASGANTGAATLVLPRPAGTAVGDVLVAATSMRGAPTITPPAGWTLVRRDAKKTSFSQAIFVHVATGAEPATYTFSLGASVTAVGTIAAYAGVDTAGPVAASGGQVNGKSTTATAPSITPGVANTRLVGFFMATTKTTFSPAAGMTERAEVVSPGATSSKVTGELADEAVASSGGTGARAATIGKSANSIGQLVALRPA